MSRYGRLRKENVRQESQLMSAYIAAHKRGDAKTKMDVQKHINRNVAQREMYKRGAY